MYTFENFYLDCLAKFAVSFFCGLLLGLERKRRFHTVGFRTLILISLSSTLMGMISYIMAEQCAVKGDPTRIAAGVVTGIGFVGGGAIMHQGLNIKGLTSAAIIWASCAMGLACSVGAYFMTLIVLLVSLLSLILLGIFEQSMFPAEKNKSLTLTYEDKYIDIPEIQKIIAESNLIQRDMDISYRIEKKEIVIRFIVKIQREYDFAKITQALKNVGNLKKISITEK